MPSTPSTARAIAWDILQRVEDGAFADVLLGRVGDSQLDRRDRALVTRLVYGTLAWQGYLDYLLQACCTRRFDDLEAPLRVLLRLALFQITKLTRVPTFAVVDTAVDLSKSYRKGAGRGLVNAVLRRAAREWQSIPLPPVEPDLAAHLSIRLSHPQWLVEHWLTTLGVAATEALLAADNEEAPTVLRVNPMRATREGVIDELRAAGHEAEATHWSPAGIRLTAGGFPLTLPAYTEGRVSVQAEASQLVALLTAASNGQRVLDACAAPGGKASHIAELMRDNGAVVALDPHEAGVRRITRMAQRLGLASIDARRADATSWEPPAGEAVEFDCVLLDAPCTGLGTLRAHPEIRWRRTLADVRRAASLQQKLLRHAARFVRPNGALVYATCTLTAAENADRIVEFLRESEEFVLDDPRSLLPGAVRSLVGDDLFLRTVPSLHGMDGFFAARLKRRGRTGIVST